jgi:hypothetical protein
LATTLAAQAQAQPQASDEFVRASALWGLCFAHKTEEFARGPAAIDELIENVQSACRDEEQHVRDILAREYGPDMARDVPALVLRQSRDRIRQQALEARGTGPGNQRTPNFLLGQCVAQHTVLIARSTTSAPDGVVDDALLRCSAELDAVRAWARTNVGEANTDRYMDSVRRSLREEMLPRVAEARASR